MFRQVKRWKNFLNFLPQMFNSSTIAALAGNYQLTAMTDNQQHTQEKVQNKIISFENLKKIDLEILLLYCDKYSIDLNLNYQTN